MGGRRRRGAAAGDGVRGVGREWEWEREMGLDERTEVDRRRREKDGRCGRRRTPRWWQVSGGAVEAMAAAAESGGGGK
jgi:hypothetical protein